MTQVCACRPLDPTRVMEHSRPRPTALAGRKLSPGTLERFVSVGRCERMLLRHAAGQRASLPAFIRPIANGIGGPSRSRRRLQGSNYAAPTGGISSIGRSSCALTYQRSSARRTLKRLGQNIKTVQGAHSHPMRSPLQVTLRRP